MALRFSSSYMLELFRQAGVSNPRVHVQGWVVPNKAPQWWVPIGHAIGRTPLRGLGMDVCTVGEAAGAE